jgi:hypothetical protein
LYDKEKDKIIQAIIDNLQNKLEILNGNYEKLYDEKNLIMKERNSMHDK